MADISALSEFDPSMGICGPLPLKQERTRRRGVSFIPATKEKREVHFEQNRKSPQDHKQGLETLESGGVIIPIVTNHEARELSSCRHLMIRVDGQVYPTVCDIKITRSFFKGSTILHMVGTARFVISGGRLNNFPDIVVQPLLCNKTAVGPAILMRKAMADITHDGTISMKRTLGPLASIVFDINCGNNNTNSTRALCSTKITLNVNVTQKTLLASASLGTVLNDADETSFELPETLLPNKTVKSRILSESLVRHYSKPARLSGKSMSPY